MLLLLYAMQPPPRPRPTAECGQIHDPFFCPTKWQLFEQLSALLRPGRATQTHRDTLEIDADVGTAWPPDNPWGATLTVMQQYWAAFAEVLEYLHARACALIPEFFCSTVAETRAEWNAEYAFPDPCEAYDDLCEKVNAIGGVTCAYFVALAAKRGWAVRCRDCAEIPDYASADSASADCSAAYCDDGCGANVILIDIDLASSPAYAAPLLSAAADCAAADCSDLCDPDVEALKCLIERVKPAHVRAIYVVN